MQCPFFFCFVPCLNQRQSNMSHMQSGIHPPQKKSMEKIVCLGLSHLELCCIRDALCSQHLSLLASWMAFICWCFSHHILKLSHTNTHTFKHPGRHRKRVNIGRVHAEMVPLLYATQSNLWTLFICLHHSPLPWFQYQMSQYLWKYCFLTPFFPLVLFW